MSEVRPFHWIARFFSSIRPGRPKPEDEAWALGLLSEREAAQFTKMSNPDRRHSIAVTREVDRELDPTEFASLGPGWQQKRMENFTALVGGAILAVTASSGNQPGQGHEPEAGESQRECHARPVGRFNGRRCSPANGRLQAASRPSA